MPFLVRTLWLTKGKSARCGLCAKAFSSEVDTGSREENASKQESRAPFRFVGTDTALGGGGEMHRLRLKAGPLHLAAIVLAHFACMSLIVWLSL